MTSWFELVIMFGDLFGLLIIMLSCSGGFQEFSRSLG